MKPLTVPRDLPHKMSALILRALDDLEAVERKKATYRIDMSFYHAPGVAPGFKMCSVCFAGAILASCNSPRRDIHPANLPYMTKRKLFALDYIRSGSLGSANSLLGIESKLMYWAVTQYDRSPTFFKADMRAIAAAYAAEGN